MGQGTNREIVRAKCVTRRRHQLHLEWEPVGHAVRRKVLVLLATCQRRVVKSNDVHVAELLSFRGFNLNLRNSLTMGQHPVTRVV
jgi:hypothetical protein